MTKAGSPIRIDQVLHGYDRGHRELASSRNLNDAARTTMSSLSDLLKATPLQEGEHYLAIYPLKSASAHVVARTWPAGDGYRPGSVWTHSLLLSYEALALLPDLTVLERLLACPNGLDHSAYRKSLSFDDIGSTSRQPGDPRAPAALFQIYGSDLEAISLPSIPNGNDHLALALWSQMWPALRREFSSLTIPCDRRPSFPGNLTLRFHSENTDINLPSDWRETRGLEQLEADLHSRGPTKLRSFLARYAVEAEHPRRMALPLAWYFGSENVPSRQILDGLRRSSPGENFPRLTRDLILADFAKLTLSEQFVELAKETRDEELAFDIAPIVAQATLLDTGALAALLPAIANRKHATLGAGLFDALVKQLPAEQLAAITSMRVKQILLQRRGDLVGQQAFWPTADAKRAKLLGQVGNAELTWVEAEALFGEDIGPKTAHVLVERSEPLAGSTLVAMLSHPSEALREAAIAWLFDEPGRLSRMEPVINQISGATIKRIACSQIDAHSLFDAKFWANVLGENDAKRRAKELTVVGGAAALCSGRRKDFALAKSDGLALLALCRSGRLSSGQTQFLDHVVPRGTYRAGLDDRIIEQFLRKWPEPTSLIAILERVADAAIQEDFVRAAARIKGRAAVTELSKQRGLSKPVRRPIEAYLEKTKPIPFPFGWLFD